MLPLGEVGWGTYGTSLYYPYSVFCHDIIKSFKVVKKKKKESWAPKNWCFWTVVLEKILESPLDCKKIQPVHPKGDQSWVFIGRTDVEAETPTLWPPHVKSWLMGKDPNAGKNWGQEEKEMTEDEMAGWHHRLDGHGFGWTPGVGDGQGGLACCNSWGRKESDRTEQLNWTELCSIRAESFLLWEHPQVFAAKNVLSSIINLPARGRHVTFI